MAEKCGCVKVAHMPEGQPCASWDRKSSEIYPVEVVYVSGVQKFGEAVYRAVFSPLDVALSLVLCRLN